MKNKIRIPIILMLLLISIISLSACTSSIAYYSYKVPGHYKMNYSYLNGAEKASIKAGEGQSIVLDYSSKVTKGDLAINITDPDDKVVAEIDTNTEGTREIKAEKDGKYHLIIDGVKARGNFDIKWKVK